MDTSRLAAEAQRLFRRYSQEVIEALGICPYAEQARLQGHAQPVVLFDRVGDAAAAAAELTALGGRENIEIGFLIYPLLRMTRPQFEAFVRRVREVYGRDPGPRGVEVAVVAFHPEAEADTSNAMRLVSFLRRTPDPTIQVIRLSSLERVRRGESHGTTFIDPSEVDLQRLIAAKHTPALHERIAAANLATVERVGVQHVEAILHDIAVDRARSYQRLGVDLAAPAAP